MSKKKFEKLVDFILKNEGFVHNGLEIKQLTNGDRCVITTEDIDEEELLLHIPENLRLTVGKAKEIPALSHLSAQKFMHIPFTNFYRDCALTALLLYHQNLSEKSFFEPYCAVLPEFGSFSSHPLWSFQTADFEGLARISYRSAVMLRHRFEKFKAIADEMALLQKKHKIFDSAQLDEKQLLHTYLCVCTRQWDASGLVPVADLLQHDNQSSVCLFHDEDEEDYMFSDKKLRAGDEIFDNYLVLDHAKQYTCYGFIDKPDDEICERKIQFKNGLIAEYSARCGDFLTREWDKFLLNNEAVFYIDQTDISPALKYFLRIASCDANERENIAHFFPYYKNIISERNEQAVRQETEEIIGALGFSEANFEEAMRILNDENASAVQKNFAKTAIFDKKIIHAWQNRLARAK